MYVGIDVHKEFCQAAFVNAKGEVIKEQRFENTTSGIEELVKATKKSNVVIESSSSSMRLYDSLSKTANVKVAHPAKVKAIASARIKTDKIDARILAQLLRANLIPESYVPSKEIRDSRFITRHRKSLVNSRTRIKNQIQSLLTREGIKLPFKDVFGIKGLSALRGMELDEVKRISIDSMLNILDKLDTEIKEIDKLIEVKSSNDKYAKLLVTIPGVSWYSALLISSEISDINRFDSHKKLCSYAGLVPSIYQSGNTERKGHITKQGSKIFRWILIQDARVSVKYSKRFGKVYKKLSKRIGEKKAIVAIARKLCVTIYFMLVRNEPFKDESKRGKSAMSCGHKDRPK